jgi:hypothetical protein
MLIFTVIHIIAPKNSPPPVNASFARMAAKSPPSLHKPQSQMEDEANHKQGEKEESSIESPPSVNDQDTFPSLEFSTAGFSSINSNQPSSDPMGK